MSEWLALAEFSSGVFGSRCSHRRATQLLNGKSEEFKAQQPSDVAFRFVTLFHTF